MRKAVSLILMITLLLTGCSAASEDTEKFADLREKVTLAGEISARAVISADYGDKVQTYTLAYTQNAEGARVEILEPELLRGISASVAGEGMSLEFDGLILDTGMLGDEGLTPVSALPAIVESIRNGHLESSRREKSGDTELLAFEITVTDTATQTLWLGGEAPVRAELRNGERVVITCEFLEWGIN